MAEQSVFKNGMRLIRELVSMHPAPFAVAVVGSALYAGATVGSTVVLGRITDRVLYPTFDDGAIPSGSLTLAILAVLAMTFLRVTGVVTRRYFAGMTSERGQRSLRKQLTEKYLNLPLSWHHRTPTGQLLAHADNDADVATELLHPLPFSLGVAFLAIFSSASLLVIDVWLALVAFLIFPALTTLNQVYSRRVEGPAAEVQAAVGVVSATAHESFDGALVVKTLGRADAEGQRFSTAAHQLRSNRVRVGYIRAVFESIMDALPNLGIVLVVVFGIYRIEAGAISRGDLVQVAALFTVLALPMRVLGFFLEMMPPSVVSRRRLNRVFHEPDPSPINEPARLPTGPLSLVVNDLTFAYDTPPDESDNSHSNGRSHNDINHNDINHNDTNHNHDHNGAAGVNGDLDGAPPGDPEHSLAEIETSPEPVLAGVSFSIEPGEVVALVGSTGAGKSTLCHLVSGLIPPAVGAIEVGGQPLRRIPDDERTAAVSLVFQESFLFADTVRANIDLSGDATDADIARVAAIAQVDGFVSELAHGYDTVVGERGVTLSGGQRQRVALARALIRHPRLLLLDDATSAVDPKIEQRILTGLRTGEAPTSLIVAQRVSTIKLADRVLYLAGGRIVGDGHHDELMANPGYAALVKAYETASR